MVLDSVLFGVVSFRPVLCASSLMGGLAGSSHRCPFFHGGWFSPHPHLTSPAFATFRLDHACFHFLPVLSCSAALLLLACFLVTACFVPLPMVAGGVCVPIDLPVFVVASAVFM